MAEGQIYKIHSDFYYVGDGTSSQECKIREVLKKQREKILVGDFVEFAKVCLSDIAMEQYRGFSSEEIAKKIEEIYRDTHTLSYDSSEIIIYFKNGKKVRFSNSEWANIKNI